MKVNEELYEVVIKIQLRFPLFSFMVFVDEAVRNEERDVYGIRDQKPSK